MRAILLALGRSEDDIAQEYNFANAQQKEIRLPDNLKSMDGQQATDYYCGGCHAKDGSSVSKLDLNDPEALRQAGGVAYVEDGTMPPYSPEQLKLRGYDEKMKQKILDFMKSKK